MRLSLPDAQLMIDKYTSPDSPSIVAVLLSSSRVAKVSGRLSWRESLLLVTPEHAGEQGISFPAGVARFEYADAPTADDWQRSIIKERFEGVLCVISPSGDRLYIFEPKPEER
jgi:hypothetical protein